MNYNLNYSKMCHPLWGKPQGLLPDGGPRPMLKFLTCISVRPWPWSMLYLSGYITAKCALLFEENPRVGSLTEAPDLCSNFFKCRPISVRPWPWSMLYLYYSKLCPPLWGKPQGWLLDEGPRPMLKFLTCRPISVRHGVLIQAWKWWLPSILAEAYFCIAVNSKIDENVPFLLLESEPSIRLPNPLDGSNLRL